MDEITKAEAKKQIMKLFRKTYPTAKVRWTMPLTYVEYSHTGYTEWAGKFIARETGYNDREMLCGASLKNVWYR